MKHPRGKPYTIALAFKEQICESVPVTENDVPIDEILYEDCWKYFDTNLPPEQAAKKGVISINRVFF